MSYPERVAQYCSDIDRVSRTVLLAESELRNGNLDISGIREMVSEVVGEALTPYCDTPLNDLQEYCQGAAYFFQQHGQESPKIQAGRLFGFRPDKFSGEVTTGLDGAVILVEFTDIQDFMHAKYAMRKGVFSQEDRTA